MKNIFKKIYPIIILTAIVFSFPSCEEDTDQWIYDGEALATFPNETSSAFFVQDVADPSFTIEVALNTLSGSERSVNVTVDSELSSAIEGTHFTMNATVTIPANEVIGILKITGIYANLPNEALNLVLKLSGDNVADYDNSYTLGLNKFVPFEISNFVGTFECTEHSYFGDFTYDVILTEVDGENAVTIASIGAGMEAAYGLPIGEMNDVKVSFDISDPASFSCHMAEAEAFINGGVASTYSESSGILNTLTNSFSLGEVVIADAEGAWDIIAGLEFNIKTP